MKIHALWCHPRSVSTAFERVMRERGDLDVLHEPFMYDYYLNQFHKPFADFSPEPGHPRTFADIRNMILKHAQNGTVFFKDMAYYVQTQLPNDPEFLHQMSHCFLVRDPAESVVSYYRRDPEFSLTEIGIEAQWHLYEALCDAGITPMVITADDLRDDPISTMRRYWDHVGLSFEADAFTWNTEIPTGWESVKDWHATALSSGAIKPASNTQQAAEKLCEIGAPYTDYEAHHRVFYEKLTQVAHQQLESIATHQK